MYKKITIIKDNSMFLSSGVDNYDLMMVYFA